jgi:hemin uptake protein HemP
MTTPSRDGIKNSPAAVAGSDAESGRERTIIVNGDRLQSTDLFADRRELYISHGDDTYRLRRTFQNKLILTK